MEFAIRPMGPSDWPAVRAVYLEGIATGNATFETEAPQWERWDAAHLAVCRFVACRYASCRLASSKLVLGHPDAVLADEVLADEVLGFAVLSAVSTRKVYAGVAEVSVYIAEQARGAGVGATLLRDLVRASEAAGIWTLQAGIFPENGTSLRLHEKCGFRVLGVRRRVGCLAGQWRDVVLLERRSAVVGV